MNPDRKIEFLWKVLDRVELLIRAADQKLSFLLVLTTAALSGAAAVMSGKFTVNISNTQPELLGILLGLILTSGALSLLLGLAVLVPRTWRKRKHEMAGPSLLFFSDIHRLPSDAYFAQIAALDEDVIIRDLSCQIESLSDIAAAKMAYVRWLTLFAAIEIIGLSGILGLIVFSG
ncbi:MAG: Pycsar system effector family protein [Candidatus Latescibacterota bacterium]